jgi:hypothetical protein
MENFFDKDLLETEYLKTLKEAYEDCKNTPLLNPYRNYHVLLDSLNSICQYEMEHARSFVKRIKDQQKDFKNCEAIFTEIIVYSYYLKLVQEQIVKSLDIKENDYDLKIELRDGTSHFLEIFCIMPDIKVWTKEEIERREMEAIELKTHLQSLHTSSIRQKLLEKIVRKGQMSKPRRNFAVIELNDPRIANDFTILSSLSGGYKVIIDPTTRKIIREGFDWSESVFNGPLLQNLRGIIYFSLGDYTRRKFIFNSNFKLTSTATVT